MSEKAMVLCSGGVDSTTCLALAIEKHGKENVCALSIYYGQKHVKEIQAAKAVLEYYGIEGTSLDLTRCSRTALLAAFPSTEDIPRNPTPSSWRRRRQAGYDLCAVPQRSVPVGSGKRCAVQNCSVIYYGAHHDDAAGNAYPDCSEEFVNAMNHPSYSARAVMSASSSVRALEQGADRCRRSAAARSL
ncbi:MAG: 7-cyano-7-deazaguanine synthase [Butyricicoccus sp.]